jgi:hypothetical protein
MQQRLNNACGQSLVNAAPPSSDILQADAAAGIAGPALQLPAEQGLAHEGCCGADVGGLHCRAELCQHLVHYGNALKRHDLQGQVNT